MKTYLLLVLLAGLSVPCHAEWRERRGALNEMHSTGEFRIFYSLSGADALRSSEDSNRNGTPDYVERIATELAAAREMYERSLQLRDPLRSPRYKNEAEFIDVHLLEFPLTSNGAKYGIAYDELSSFERSRDSGRKIKVLVIDLSHDLPAGNATAAHELFHLYQNGYTFFKNRWFTEGTARWVEGLGKKVSLGVGQLPDSLAEVQELFQKTYATAPFWSSIANRVDAANGGRAFLKALLEDLDRMDDVARTQSGLGSRPWKEADQMSPANDAHIWRALQNTLERPAFRQRWDADVRGLMGARL